MDDVLHVFIVSYFNF